MKLIRLPWAHVSDAEYVANARRQISVIGRIRPWFIVLNVVMLVALIWIAQHSVAMLIDMVRPPQWAVIGFGTGVGIGAFVGFSLHEIAFNLIFAIGNFRSERMLIRYYDAFNESIGISNAAVADEP